MTGELAAALRQDGEETQRRRAPRSSRPRSPRWSDWSQEKKISHGAARRSWRRSSPRAATRPAIVEREGLAQISDSGELESIVAAAIEANPEAAEQIRAGNGRRSARSSAP